jgi:hypothetical protein
MGAFAGASEDSHAGLTAMPATCSMCGCGPPSGGTCTATIQMYTDGNCTTQCGLPITVSSGCTPYGPCDTDGNPQSESSSTTIQAGTCTPNGGAPTLPAVSWSTNARVCAYSGTTSACAGGTCYAAPSAPFAGPCVTQMGDVACPMFFPNKSVVYQGVSDGRGCTTCTCNNATGQGCNNYLQFWHNSTCSDFPVTSALLPALSCADTYTSSYVGSSVKGGLTVVGGSCTSSGGGAPTGTAMAASPVTVCCE